MPATTPRRKPAALLSEGLRNRLPWPHSCISAKTRRVRNVITSTATVAVSHQDSVADMTAPHQNSARGTSVVTTWVIPVISSDLPYRPIIACLYCLTRSIDDSMETPFATKLVSMERQPGESSRAAPEIMGPEQT